MIFNVGRLPLRVVLVFALACLSAAAAGAVEPPQKGGAALRLVDKAPLVLRGTGFKPAERVRLTVKAGAQRRVRALIASRTGTFQTTFTQLRVDPCELDARAVGAAGTAAAYKLPARMCPIPAAP